MFLLLILPILVSGFIVCNTHLSYIYRLHRYDGQHLYLKSAFLGFICLIIFSLLALFCHSYIPENLVIPFTTIELNLSIISFLAFLLEGIADTAADTGRLAWVVLLSIGTLVTAWFYAFLGNKLQVHIGGSVQAAKLLEMRRLMLGNPLDRLLFESFMDESRSIMLSMEGRKVYVGTISELGEPNESEGIGGQTVAFIPLMSGYRKQDTLEVVFTTQYELVDADFEIAVRYEDIQMAFWFDFNTYKKLNPPPKLTKKASSVSKKITGRIKISR